MIKRIFDIFFSVVGLIFLFPAFCLISTLIIIFSGFPVLFLQNRVGRSGRIFILLKFRTMDTQFSGKVSTVTTANDPRITRIGRFLRKSKLDELPSFINVFVGDMSFVGPRPDVQGYADKLESSDRRILKLRPGITGPASLKYSNEEKLLTRQLDPIKYNNEIIFPDKVKINLDYLENQSFFGDIKLIFRTIFKVITIEK